MRPAIEKVDFNGRSLLFINEVLLCQRFIFYLFNVSTFFLNDIRPV